MTPQLNFLKYRFFHDKNHGYALVDYLLKYPLVELLETLQWIFDDAFPNFKDEKIMVFSNGSAIDQKLYEMIKPFLPTNHRVMTITEETKGDIDLTHDKFMSLVEKYNLFTAGAYSIRDVPINFSNVYVIAAAESLRSEYKVIFLSTDSTNQMFSSKYVAYYEFCNQNGGIPSILSLISSNTPYFKSLFEGIDFSKDEINLFDDRFQHGRINNTRWVIKDRNGIRQTSFEENLPLLRRLWPAPGQIISPVDGLSTFTIPLSEVSVKFFTYYDNGNPVGTTHVYNLGDGRWRLRGTWVYESYRNQKIASKLFNRVLSYVKSENGVSIETFPRLGTEDFYKYLGFTVSESPFIELGEPKRFTTATMLLA
jgi:GNAT superfamily N-acetyltransferase